MQYLKVFLEALKLPKRLIFCLALSSALMLWSSGELLAKLHLEKLVATYGQYIGIVCAIAWCLFLIDAAIWFFGRISHWWHWRNRQAAMISTIQKSVAALDYCERAVLREFWIQGARTINLPADNPTVAGLLEKSVLVRVGGLGATSVVGFLWPMSIHEIAEALLTAEAIDLPLSPTELDIQQAMMKRPDFADRIDDLNRLRNGRL